MDLAASLLLLALAAAIGVAFAARRSRMHYARVERDGGSILLDTSTMNAAYWALQPIGRACVRAGISANAVTLASLALSLAAGVLLATGHFGLAAVVTAFASLGDALDGLVARASGTASPAGEVLDAAVDRYAEVFFLGGVAIHYRDSGPTLALVLLALLGSFMVSYASAKAEALQVAAPRGAMRRAERATYLALGALLVPITTRIFSLEPWWIREAPMLAALGLVGVVGNVSAIRRLHAVALAVGGATVDAPARRTLATLGKHQLGSIIATAVDFTLMTSLVELGVVDPVRATLVGSMAGGLTNFLLGRRWIFQAADGAPMPQAARYAVVSGASAAWNTLGEHLLHDQLALQYVVARILVAVSVSVAWNFPLQRWWVFRTEAPHKDAARP